MVVQYPCKVKGINLVNIPSSFTVKIPLKSIKKTVTHEDDAIPVYENCRIQSTLVHVHPAFETIVKGI